MPNWCSNVLVLESDNKEKLDEIQKAFESKNLLNYLRPRLKEAQMTKDWQLDNWGTELEVDGDAVRESDNKLILIFNSAWTPPIRAIQNLTCDFDLSYYELGMQFCGEIVRKNGILLKDAEYSFDEAPEHLQEMFGDSWFMEEID